MSDDDLTRVALVVAAPLLREGLAEVLGSEPTIVLVAVADGSAVHRSRGDRTSTSWWCHLGAGHEPASSLVSASARIVTLHDDLAPAQAARLIERSGVIPVDTHSSPEVLVTAVLGAATRAPLQWARPTIGPMPLSPRERTVLALVAAGMTSRDIATQLTISARTVENHKQRILERLGVASQAQAVALATRSGPTPRGRGCSGWWPVSALAAEVVPSVSVQGGRALWTEAIARVLEGAGLDVRRDANGVDPAVVVVVEPGTTGWSANGSTVQAHERRVFPRSCWRRPSRRPSGWSSSCRLGAFAVLTTTCDAARLAHAVRWVAAGESGLSRAQTRTLGRGDAGACGSEQPALGRAHRPRARDPRWHSARALGEAERAGAVDLAPHGREHEATALPQARGAQSSGGGRVRRRGRPARRRQPRGVRR